MKVRDLRRELRYYSDDAEVVIVDWSNGIVFSPSIGSDDPDEGEAFCRIGIDSYR